MKISYGLVKQAFVNQTFYIKANHCQAVIKVSTVSLFSLKKKKVLTSPTSSGRLQTMNIFCKSPLKSLKI